MIARATSVSPDASGAEHADAAAEADVKPTWRAFDALPYALGVPPISGRLRERAEDFVVDEVLAFDPDGDGEHCLIRIRKTGVNTEWAARRLASFASVPAKAVGYAGLKDRHAVTTQWFSLHLGKLSEPRWRLLAEDGIEVLESHRHRRKLKRGALAGNRFAIRIRDLAGDLDAAGSRAAAIAARGVPNYFGPQRFGRNEGNLHRADALFKGAAPRASRHQRGLWLSAARSQIFNELLALRVERGDWATPLRGDRLQLRGSHSHFLVDTVDDALMARVASGDALPTGPLVGGGTRLTAGEVAEIEDQVEAQFSAWMHGLIEAGLTRERRPLRLDAEDLRFEPEGPDTAIVQFLLPAGSYATVLLRELVAWRE